MATGTATVLQAEPLATERPAAVLVPLETYLRTTYRPDCDWLNGELKERHMGETPHATIKGFLVWTLTNFEVSLRIRVLPEQRVQTSAQNYRVADVCVVREETGYEPIIRTLPLLCVEVLCRDDRMTDVHEKIDDYLGMGVETVWIIDPRRRKAQQATRGGALVPASEELTVLGTSLSVPVAGMFAKLDWMQIAEK